MKQRTRVKRWVRRLLLAAVPVGLIAVLVLWMLFQHIPAWYTPVVIRQEDYQRVRDNLLETEESFTHRVLAPQPFTFTLTDAQINEWIAARHAIWQPAARWIPPQIENPIIRFRPGMLILAGLLHYKDAKVIASAHLTAEAHDGRIHVQLLGLHGGSLPLPTQWLIDTAIEQVRAHQSGRNQSKPSRRPDPDEELIRQLTALPTGAQFPNLVTWPNGKRDFLVESITFGEGTCTLGLRPSPATVPTR